MNITVLLLVFAIAVQIPLGILIYFDARRIGMDNPDVWLFGIWLPAGGFMVFVVYLMQRKTAVD